ncbi:MAG: hypothetical protein AB7N54_14280 [Alphaproteobacteria bacterium]
MTWNIFDWALIAVVFSLPASFVVLLLFYRDRVRSRYDEQRRAVEISLLRDDIELRLNKLNERLMSSPDNWRELNHLLISAQKSSIEGEILRNRIADYEQTIFNFQQEVPLSVAKNLGVNLSNEAPDPKLVFMLTPFHKRASAVYTAVKSIVSDVGMTCFRGDEQFVQGDLLPHIISMLYRARLIIANVDGRNPNVFYELGIAHSMGKDVIIISKNVSEMPFDLKSHKIIVYKSGEDLSEALKREMLKLFSSK